MSPSIFIYFPLYISIDTYTKDQAAVGNGQVNFLIRVGQRVQVRSLPLLLVFLLAYDRTTRRRHGHGNTNKILKGSGRVWLDMIEYGQCCDHFE